MEELHEQWKESIAVSIYMTSDKTETVVIIEANHFS
jgi:hypothetical protein